MADLFELDADTLATVELGIDSLIRQLGKDCKVVYEAEKTVCPNCIFDTSAGRSSNIYNSVGPKPFTKGKCPVCKGNGFLPGTGVTEEVVKMLVDWTPKPWLYTDPNNTGNVRLPQGIVMTKGFVADLPKVIQAKYVVIDYVNAKYTTNRFVKYGEPTLQGNIVKSKYYVCFWQRFGD